MFSCYQFVFSGHECIFDFWENMVVDENEIEFETPEILSLIYKHSPQKNLDELDETLLEMIKHYYPDVIVEQNTSHNLTVNCGIKIKMY